MQKPMKDGMIASMNPEELEQVAAQRVMNAAQTYAHSIANPCDVKAATVAILVAAIELATPDLIDSQRASLFAEQAR